MVLSPVHRIGISGLGRMVAMDYRYGAYPRCKSPFRSVGACQWRPMKRTLAVLALIALISGVAYGSYVWGWYRGTEYHSVVSGMSEAKVSLDAARSIRQADPQLALELLDANISWMSASLSDTSLEVPEAERANYEMVLERLRHYRAQYGRTGQ